MLNIKTDSNAFPFSEINSFAIDTEILHLPVSSISSEPASLHPKSSKKKSLETFQELRQIRPKVRQRDKRRPLSLW